jgi:hypothetical protein
VSLDLSDYEAKAKKAVRHFWKQRSSASKKNSSSERRDQGERGAVTAGKNMDGFVQLVKDVVRANGLPDAECHVTKQLLTLPGYFRPTKMWDLVVTHQDHLVAAIEFKSHVGPSFGNNFNNRTEEALGTATDIWTAYREGAFGKGAPQPFVGWLMLLEEADGSTKDSRLETLPKFAPFPEFVNASYARRYEILCEKLVREQLYTASALMLSPRTAARSGSYREMSRETGLQQFLARLAAFVVAESVGRL